MAISPPPGTRSISDCSDSYYCYYSPAPLSPPSYYPPPLLPPPPTTTHDSSISKVLQKSSKNLTLIVVLFLCALAMAFLFLSYLIVRKQRNSRARSRNSGSRRRGRAATTRNDDTGNPVDLDLDLLDDNHGQVVDHPIWYIRTVGLQKSVIESIAVFKYKRDESLIEGSDCSVCLSEFEEDETLRLLPKCSHAFHIHCIDTWLSSHQNCPLCRAPIVSTLSATDLPGSTTVIAISDQAQSDNSTAVDPDPESLMNSQSQPLDHMFPDEVNLRLAVDQSSVVEDDRDTLFSGGRNTRSQSRVLSDLSHHRRSILKEEDEEEGSEGMGRRSVSLDASSAANLTSIFLAIAKTDVEACSSNELAPTMKNNKSITSRVTKTYSLGRFLQRGGPPAHTTTDLKRSTSASSSGGFFSLSSRH